MKILVTGTAGFIGFHTAKKLLERGDTVVGLDNINDYYDTELKYGRLKETGIEKDNIQYNVPVRSVKHNNYRFVKMDLGDRENLPKLFEKEKFDAVCNLAAQAGVRYSLENPYAYIDSNINGFMNILECCRYGGTKHLVYASTSSVYGLNKKIPFSTKDNVDHPITLYAASKKSNELMAHTYSHLFGIPTTGLRFFTVYGPWGRPDMAYFKFTRLILEGKAIDVYNDGNLKRDFTYVDDIVEGVVRVIDNPPTGNNDRDIDDFDPGRSNAPYRVYNIGNNSPENLMDFIGSIEKALGKKAKKNMKPMQPGDMFETYADVDDLIKDVGFKPDTPLQEGINRFVEWYREYYR